jgi:hypothetical protein
MKVYQISESNQPCSFCWRSLGEAGLLVEGAGLNGTGGVLICRECAFAAIFVIERETERRALKVEAPSERPAGPGH